MLAGILHNYNRRDGCHVDCIVCDNATIDPVNGL